MRAIPTGRLESDLSTAVREKDGLLAVVFGQRYLLRVLVIAVFSCGMPHFMSAQASAQDTVDYFRQNCKSCHTIGGGRLTGPDLKGVSSRQDREWLIKFIMDPNDVIKSGDPYANQLFKEYNKMLMPPPVGITRERAEKLLDLIEAESKLEKSQFKGLEISTAPFTDTNRTDGRNIFLGPKGLEAGGSACISCHSMYDTPALGGGQLGPDLTNVFGQYKDRATLSAWLSAPATETMGPIFKKHPLSADEIHELVAYFESTAGQQPADKSTGRIAFLLCGLASAVIGIFFLDTIWKGRFQSVRRSLVEANSSRGKS